jgi:hypothetical protein
MQLLTGARPAPSRFERRVRRTVVAILAVVACVGCASKTPPRTHVAAPPLHSGPITELVPAAGLRWLVVARPSELLGAPGLREEVERLFPASRLEAFALATGVDLREVPAALAAGFDLGILYVAETTEENSIVEARLVARMVGEPRRFEPHPALTRLEGTSRGRPFAFVRHEGRLVAASVGDLTYGRVVELYLLGKLRRSPSALKGAALSLLPAELGRAPLRLYASGPLPPEWQTGARGLLGATLAAGIGAWPEGDGRILRIEMAFVGSWEGEDVERLAAGWEDVARSSLGRLLGLDAPLSPPEVALQGGRLSLTVRLGLGPLVSGLRAAVISDVWELLEVSRAPAAPPG